MPLSDDRFDMDGEGESFSLEQLYQDSFKDKISPSRKVLFHVISIVLTKQELDV